MAEPDFDLQALREAVFAGELTAEQAASFQRALLARQQMLHAASETGELNADQLAELADIDRYLEVLEEEELIAEFVDDALVATMRHREIEEQAGELEPPE